jgi:site-specific recombinase XerD
MSIYKDKATGQWRFDFDRVVDGRRLRKRRLLPAGWTRAQAEAYDRKEGAALHALAAGIAKPRRTIDAAVTLYKRERAAGLKAGANALREIEATRDWWEGRAVEDLPSVCQEYATDQMGALAPATIKNRISYLRAACRWAWKRHGWGESDPGARVVAPVVRNARDVSISRAQMVMLARSCRHRGVRALIRILYWSGMRVSEAQRAERRGEVFVLRDTKNDQPRLVPILSIITSASRMPMPPRSVIDYWWPLARAACDLKHVHLHDLRHAAASAMVDGGVDLGTVGAVLGHKSTATTKRYAHHGVGRLAEALGKIRKRA